MSGQATGFFDTRITNEDRKMYENAARFGRILSADSHLALVTGWTSIITKKKVAVFAAEDELVDSTNSLEGSENEAEARQRLEAARTRLEAAQDDFRQTVDRANQEIANSES